MPFPLIVMAGLMAAVVVVREVWWPSDPPSRKRKGRPKTKASAPSISHDHEDDEDARPAYFDDFRTLAEQVAVPLFETGVDDRPLVTDSEAYRGKPIYWFDRDGITWGMNGDTRLWPIMAALNWMKAHDGQDPFVVRNNFGRRKTLELRSEVRWLGPKYLYIYEATNQLPEK